MVRIAPPPPARPPKPLFQTLHAGTKLYRLFDPTNHGATATSFRYWVPTLRFDHQQGQGPECDPCYDAERGIYYAAPTFSSCIAEVFGDYRVIEYGELHIARLRLTRNLHLLDLCGRGAMRAGSVAAIAKIPERPATQQWARFFYENPSIYSQVDGLIYLNAHNDEIALALYERAADAITCSPGDVIRLDYPDPDFQAKIYRIAEENGLIIDNP